MKVSVVGGISFSAVFIDSSSVGGREACLGWKSFLPAWLPPSSLSRAMLQGRVLVCVRVVQRDLSEQQEACKHFIWAEDCAHETSVFPATMGLKCGSAPKCFSMNICGKCLARILSIQGRTCWLQAERPPLFFLHLLLQRDVFIPLSLWSEMLM